MTTKSKAVKEALVVAELLESRGFVDRPAIIRTVADEADLYRFCHEQSVQQFCAIAQVLGLPEDGTVTPETILNEVQRLKCPVSANTFEALQERAIALEQMVREKDDTIESVRKALCYGADDALWPPGQSMGDVVAGLVDSRAYLKWEAHNNGKTYVLYAVNGVVPGKWCADIYQTWASASLDIDQSLWPIEFRWTIPQIDEPPEGGGLHGGCPTKEEAYAAIVANIGKFYGPVAAKIIPPLP